MRPLPSFPIFLLLYIPFLYILICHSFPFPSLTPVIHYLPVIHYSIKSCYILFLAFKTPPLFCELAKSCHVRQVRQLIPENCCTRLLFVRMDLEIEGCLGTVSRNRKVDDPSGLGLCLVGWCRCFGMGRSSTLRFLGCIVVCMDRRVGMILQIGCCVGLGLKSLGCVEVFGFGSLEDKCRCSGPQRLAHAQCVSATDMMKIPHIPLVPCQKRCR